MASLNRINNNMLCCRNKSKWKPDETNLPTRQEFATLANGLYLARARYNHDQSASGTNVTEHPLQATAINSNLGYRYCEHVGADASGTTLLAHLSQRYGHSCEAEWMERIASGRVLVNGKPASADCVLKQGNELSWLRPPWVEPEAPKEFTVIFEDEDILAIAKPAGLPTLPAANFLQNTLLFQVQLYAPEATPLHRLGRWTSGLVLCARNHAARKELMRQWSAREVGKRYRALASGTPNWNTLTINERIGDVPHPLLGSVHAANPLGKPALSHVVVLKQRTNAFLCDVRIETGRPHQIRIHLAAIGHPLVGDPLYCAGGIPAADSQAVPGDPGYLLHAAELSFHHPRTGREMSIECQAPVALRI